MEKIKLIRTSKRIFYKKIKDIFAECSIDYDRSSTIARNFYDTIQNKFYYTITKNTVAEIIYKRADSEKETIGLTIVLVNEMTQIRQIDNLAYFKGKLESNYIKLNKVKTLDFDNDFNIIMSIIK